MSVTTPTITLYTSQLCPWAHRAQIALRELSLPFSTELVDLATPRTASYLAINPRGLVPSLDYNGTILTESGTVVQFLTDAHPSHLVKASNENGGALQRARIGFFVNTYENKVNGLMYGILKAKDENVEAETTKFVDAVAEHLEPLLKDAAPYFGGSEKFGLAEVLIAPFAIRVLAFAKEGSMIPKTLLTQLSERAPAYFKWANEVIKQESVLYKWDAEVVIGYMAERIGAMKETK